VEIIMKTGTLNRVIEELKGLTAEEQKRVREVLDSLLTEEGSRTDEQGVEQRLLEKGVISRIPPRIRDAEFYANRKPIEVEGKPVSEIIIEERR
jgi:hypothetical protein